MLKRLAFATVAVALSATAVSADDHKDDRTVVRETVHKTVVRPTVVHRTVVRPTVVRGWASRSDYRTGGRIAQNDWRAGRVIDYRVYHLRAPPPGYEWREVGGRYVLAAVATGIIASIIMASQ
jgi:Ni/Co efflux regulator RcnB